MNDEPLATELFSWNSLGTYVFNCLFIRASIRADLTPSEGPVDPCAIPTHAHEYVHLLHNVSTVAGLHIFISNLWLLRLLRSGTDAHGHFRGEIFLGAEQQMLVDRSCQWLSALLGSVLWRFSTTDPTKVLAWHFEITRCTDSVIHLPRQLHTVNLVSVEGRASLPGGNTDHFTIDIGYDFISEGVAHEVDREIRRISLPGDSQHASDVTLDSETWAFPYLAYRQLLDHWVARPTTARERIDLGVYALLTTSPADTLYKMSLVLGIEAPTALATGRLPESVAAPVLDTFQEIAVDFYELNIRPELEALATDGAIKDAASELAALFRAGLYVRTVNPILENNFLAKFTVEEFKAKINTLLDVCILQAKADGPIQYDWVGAGIIAHDDESQGNLARLQMAMHFAKQHIRPRAGALVSTQFAKTGPCPFMGACPMEKRDDYPNACGSKPWERSLETKDGAPVCWYAAGVKSIARPRHPAHNQLFI
jgi:hypothetical protein